MTKTQQNKFWQNNHPMKYKAHMIVNNHVRAGKLPRVSTCTCIDCKNAQAKHYHHENYDHPLNVEPLCVPCHTARHTL